MNRYRRPGHPRRALSLIALIATAPTTHAASGEFLPLGFRSTLPAPNTPYSTATGISADGSVVVGNSNYTGYRWTRGGGMVTIDPGPDDDIDVRGVSADGSTLFGSMRSIHAMGSVYGAFRWSEARGFQSVGLSGAFRGIATGASADGSVVVGYSDNDAFVFRAFRWTEATGALVLAAPGGYLHTYANGISDDGRIVIGSAEIGGGGSQAVLWSQAGAPSLLGVLGGYSDSSGTALSSDGSVAIGNVYGAGRTEAFRWTQPGGMVGLGFLAGDVYSDARDISADGSVIVGASGTGALDTRAVRWTTAGGIQGIDQWLASFGVTVPLGMTLTRATGVSADGTVIVGDSSQQQAWIARDNSGLIVDSAEFNAGLIESNAAVGGGGLGLALLGIDGIRDRAGMRDGTGQRACGWSSVRTAGYRDDDGSAQTLEVGACGGGERTGFALGLGTARMRQDLSHDGRGEHRGHYLVAEVSTALGRHLEGSLLGYRGEYDSDVDRRYLNGAGVDTSSARVDMSATALRARLVWRDAFKAGGFDVSPYASYGRTRVRVDSYAESGGGFPASFEAGDTRLDDARLGLEAARALGPRARLLAAVEAVHRSADDEGRVRGTLDGLYDFGAAGEDRSRDSSGARVALEYSVGRRGALRFEANGGTSRDDARWGASALYRMRF